MTITFARASKGREIAYITQLLSIFGAVEVRQMRQLFAHLPDQKYGQIMSRIQRESMVFHEPGGRYLSTSQFAMQKAQVAESVRAFWVFIHIKDKVVDFCGGSEPAILSFTSKLTDYDLVPVRSGHQAEIMESANSIPKHVKRLLIVSDIAEADGLEFRMKNDFVAAVTKEGAVTLYKM